MEVEDIGELVRILRMTADKLECEDHGGLTGVAVVLEGVPGTFKEVEKPLVCSWVSMQGGRRLYNGLVTAAFDVAMLREFKGRKVQ